MIEQKKYYTIKYDAIFLAVVTRNKNILKNIIESATNEKIEEINIINSKLYKEKIMNKANFLDLVVKTEKEYINIEVNTSYNQNIINRNILYISKLMSNVSRKGEKKGNYQKIIQINLIYNHKSLDYEISRNVFYDQERKKELTKIIEIININIDKIVEKYYTNSDKLTNKLPLIMLGLKQEELEKLREESEIVNELMKVLDEMNDEGIVPLLMPIEEEKAWYEEVIKEEAKQEGLEEGRNEGLEQGIKEGKIVGIKEGIKEGKIVGIKEGIKEGKKEGLNDGIQKVAKKMLSENMDVNLIIKLTGLSKKKITQLKFEN